MAGSLAIPVPQREKIGAQTLPFLSRVTLAGRFRAQLKAKLPLKLSALLQ
jgi:hypothetical protein